MEHTESEDGGLTFKNFQRKEILGLYFFVSDTTQQHYRAVYSISDVMAALGGIAGSLLPIFTFIGTVYNEQVYTQHLLHLLYFTRDSKESKEISRS